MNALPTQAPSAAIIEKVYSEAHQWVRVVNQVIWGIGALAVPTSVAAIWAALTTSASRPFLAVGSLFLFGFWISVTKIYAKSALVARDAITAIEQAWSLDPKLRFFSRQQTLVTSGFTAARLQIFTVGALFVIWVAIIFLAPVPQPK